MTAFPVAAQLIDLLDELEKSKGSMETCIQQDKLQTHRITTALVSQLNTWHDSMTRALDSLLNTIDGLPPGHDLAVELRTIYNTLNTEVYASINQAIPTKEVPDP
jgi:hypothetical protein